MLGNIELDVTIEIIEVDNHYKELTTRTTKERILPVGIERGRMGIGIHKVVAQARDSLVVTGKVHKL